MEHSSFCFTRTDDRTNLFRASAQTVLSLSALPRHENQLHAIYARQRALVKNKRHKNHVAVAAFNITTLAGRSGFTLNQRCASTGRTISR